MALSRLTGKRTVLVVFVLAIGPFAFCLSGCDKQADKQTEISDALACEAFLADAAERLGQGLPKMIDAGTRYDGVAAGPGRTFTYYYTLVKTAPGELTQKRLSEDLRPFLLQAMNREPGLNGFRKLIYVYNAKDGSGIGQMTFKAGRY